MARVIGLRIDRHMPQAYPREPSLELLPELLEKKNPITHCELNESSQEGLT